MIYLLTGGSGFLGRYIAHELLKNGELVTLSRSEAAINADLSKEIPRLPLVDVVVHCAGKAHAVPRTPAECQAFFDVNEGGTANLLQALSNGNSLPKSFILISTVAVYGRESGTNINEDHPLNAQEPYGKSKIKAEELVRHWCLTNKVSCTILRLPLLVGENPPGNLGAMIAAIKKGYYFNIAGGTARKSMVCAQDVAALIPRITDVGGVYNLTDGQHPSFAQLAAAIGTRFGKNKTYNMPSWIAKAFAWVGECFGNRAPINRAKLAKISAPLTFDDQRARAVLNWRPKAVLAVLLQEQAKAPQKFTDLD